MNLLENIARRLGFVRKGKRAVPGYDAGQTGRLTASLMAEAEFINTTLRYQLRILRARSRQAAQNNPYARRFVQMAVDNIAGPLPFRLQAKIKNRKGDFDETSNERLEDAWEDWGRKGSCEITTRWSWNTLQRLMVRILAVDGEILLRKLRGPEYGPYGFALQLIDIDRLWEYKNQALPNGGAVHMGVEVDEIGKAVAYHVLKRKPAQWQNSGYGLDSERIPADEIAHIFVPDFAEQIRGVPWMYAALLNLVHIGAFEEAAVIAARVGATQMGFIQSPDGTADALATDGKDAKGNPQIEADPGSFPVLPEGYSIGSWNPKYPDAAVEPFLKAMLRGVSSGLNVAYHNLSGNMEGVNYSSARIAELDERDGWMGLQTFFVEHLSMPVYEDWLRMSILSGALPFDLARMEKYRAIKWQPRRWAWVDPMKEVGAQIEAINAKIKSRTTVISDGGDDIEDVFEEIEQETKLAKEKNIDLNPVQPKATGVIPDGQAAGDGSASGDTASGDANAGKSRAATGSTQVVMQDGAIQIKAEIHTPGVRVVNHVDNIVQPAAVHNHVETPEVRVDNIVQPAEVQVTLAGPVKMEVVSMPERTSVSDTERDNNGSIKRVTQIEKDAA